MGMPGWAMALGAPYAVDKLVVDPVSSIYGLYKGIRDDQAEQNDKAQLKSDLEQFRLDPGHAVDFNKYSNPNAAIKATSVFDTLRESKYKQSAAPVSSMLDRFKAEGNDADPNFSGAEWVRGMATTPAVGGQMSEAEYDAAKSGAIPGGKKGSLPLTVFGANPVVAEKLQTAEAAAQQKGALARTFSRTASPLDLATVAMNKDIAGGFENTTQGNERIFKDTNTADDRGHVSRLNQFINELDTGTYGNGQPGSFMTDITNRLRKFQADNNLTDEEAGKVANEYLKGQAEKQSKKTWDWKEGTIGQGNASKRYRYAINSNGEEIPGTKVEVTNHAPKDTGGRDDQKQRVKEFGEDLKYLRSLDRAVANGGKGMIMIDGVPTSFDGSAESLATLRGMRDDHESNMREVYPEDMKRRKPEKIDKLTGDSSKVQPIPAKGVIPLNGGYKSMDPKTGQYRYYKGAYPTAS